MNVGILSMHRTENWGSFLQAFALKKTVEELGHGCSFLDIKHGVGLKQNQPLMGKRNLSILYIMKRMYLIACRCIKGQFIASIKGRLYGRKFHSKYNNEFLSMIGVNPLSYEDSKSFDLVIIGSDEVFNCTQDLSPWGETLHLFGEGINAKKIITYAASFGHTTMADLDKYGLKEGITNAFKNISSFSVRDDNTYSIVKQLTGKSPELSVDPVIMFDFTPYMPATVPEKDYIIVYTYHGRISDSDTINAIREFAVAKNKKIISLFCYYSWCDYSIVASTPFELLAYFKNADYVVTDTFHGTIFSIKCNKNFCTIVRKTNSQKLSFLLKQFKLTNRIIKSPSEIKYKLEQGIDYTETNKVINAETLKAKTYLKEAIQIEN
jgi:hypothetical protein